MNAGYVTPVLIGYQIHVKGVTTANPSANSERSNLLRLP